MVSAAANAHSGASAQKSATTTAALAPPPHRSLMLWGLPPSTTTATAADGDEDSKDASDTKTVLKKLQVRVRKLSKELLKMELLERAPQEENRRVQASSSAPDWDHLFPQHATQAVRVTFKSPGEAAKVHHKLDGKSFLGQTLTSRREFEILTAERARTKCRLIIRNLPFTITVKTIEQKFQGCGPIFEIHLPLKEDRVKGENGEVKMTTKGFAFVQFMTHVDAKKAVSTLNATKIKGSGNFERVIAVDWAIDKSKFDASQDNNTNEEEGETNIGEEGDETTKIDSTDGTNGEEEDDEIEGDEDDESEEEDDDESDVENEGKEDSDKKEGGDAAAPASRRKDLSVEERLQKKQESESSALKLQARKESENRRTVFVRNLPFEGCDKDQIREVLSQFGEVEDVFVVMNKELGKPKGSAFVRFKDEGSVEPAVHAAKRSEDGDEESSSTSEKGRLLMSGRELDVFAAVDRKVAQSEGFVSHVTSMVTDPKKKVKARSMDRRNLFLLAEGKIEEDSPAAASVAPSEMEKRVRSHREKKDKLKSPIFYVSPTRLAVRNLNKKLTNKDLSKLFQSAANNGMKNKVVSEFELAPHLRPPKSVGLGEEKTVPVNVKKAKLMLDFASKEERLGTRTDKTLAATKRHKENEARHHNNLSKGFGFVEFEEHIHALAALRVLNNNPEYAEFAQPAGRQTTPKAKKGPKKGKEGQEGLVAKGPFVPRLIVEFAVENLAMVQKLAASKILASRTKDELPEKKKDSIVSVGKKRKGVEVKDASGPEEAMVDDPSTKRKKSKKRKRNAGNEASSSEVAVVGPSVSTHKTETNGPKKDEAPRGGHPAKPKKTKKPSEFEEVHGVLSKSAKRKRKKEIGDDFDAMVSSYREKINGGSAKGQKGESSESAGVEKGTSKWFDF